MPVVTNLGPCENCCQPTGCCTGTTELPTVVHLNLFGATPDTSGCCQLGDVSVALTYTASVPHFLGIGPFSGWYGELVITNPMGDGNECSCSFFFALYCSATDWRMCWDLIQGGPGCLPYAACNWSVGECGVFHQPTQTGQQNCSALSLSGSVNLILGSINPACICTVPYTVTL